VNKLTYLIFSLKFVIIFPIDDIDYLKKFHFSWFNLNISLLFIAIEGFELTIEIILII